MNSMAEKVHPSVGVKLLDRDHGHLEEILAEIQWRAAAGLTDGRAGELLRKMAQRLRLHFALEEGMMAATHYPGTGVHCLRHQWMIDQVELLATQRVRNRLERNAHLLSLLTASHRRHIGCEDLDYGLWLNASRPRRTDTAASAASD
jgi:hemerythrin-like metal-binding protein